MLIREAVMELNASNDRGIDVVRNKIKGFAQQKVTLPTGKHKIIILGRFVGKIFFTENSVKRRKLPKTGKFLKLPYSRGRGVVKGINIFVLSKIK